MAERQPCCCHSRPSRRLSPQARHGGGWASLEGPPEHGGVRGEVPAEPNGS